MPLFPPRLKTASQRGFTLIELIVVIVIVVIMATVAVPSLSRFMKSSRVDQAAKTVIAALYDARTQAQRFHTTVAVFYGDDPARHGANWVPPLSTTLPPQNKIEIWSVNLEGSMGFASNFTEKGYYWREDMFTSSFSTPKNPAGGSMAWNAWFPYYDKNRLVSSDSYTIPDGVRVISGYFDPSSGTFTYAKGPFNNPGHFQATPVGEIKRHNNVYTRNGAVPTFDLLYCYRHVLVYDVATGDHVVIEVGNWISIGRPRIISEKVKQVGNTTVTDYHDLDKLLNYM